MQTVLRVVVFAGEGSGDAVAFERYTAAATAFTRAVNEYDFMKADHCSLHAKRVRDTGTALPARC